MEEEREVKFERAIEFTKSHNIQKCFETSAKSGDNVEEVFSCAGQELFVQHKNDNNSNDESSSPDPTTKQPKDDPLKGKKLTGGKKKKPGQKGGCC